jgi:hypothetical protein
LLGVRSFVFVFRCRYFFHCSSTNSCERIVILGRLGFGVFVLICGRGRHRTRHGSLGLLAHGGSHRRGFRCAVRDGERIWQWVAAGLRVTHSIDALECQARGVPDLERFEQINNVVPRCRGNNTPVDLAQPITGLDGTSFAHTLACQVIRKATGWATMKGRAQG